MTTPFRSLTLGYADAQTEGTVDPRLLLEGYYELDSTIDEIRTGPKFLILGYKGSGKSAVSQHLRLLAGKEEKLFVITTSLLDFSFSEFTKIVRIEGEPESKLTTAWSWLLLIKLFESFFNDSDSPSNTDEVFSTTVEALIDMGLLPARKLSEIVLASSRPSFRIKIPSILKTTFERNVRAQNLHLPFLAEKMKEIACDFRSDSQHLFIIDGLDEMLTQEEIHYTSLAALILEVSRLNMLLRQHSSPAKIVILCRTDLYERLPGANKNKIRSDSAINLDWYHDSSEEGVPNLVKLVNTKVKVHHPDLEDIFTTFFPAEFVHRVQGKQDLVTYLLDHTRHTPRDFIQLLTKIKHSATSSGQLTQQEISSGMRSYSIDYFLPEIKDEMAGYIDRKDILTAITLISSLRQKNFLFKQLAEKAATQARYSRLDLQQIIEVLFECGAIGNRHQDEEAGIVYSFKYRNQNAAPDLDQILSLHRGMWRALNL